MIKYFLFICLFSFLLSSEPFKEYKVDKSYKPVKYSDLSINIDGLLNEKEWQNISTITDFIQAEPLYGKQPTKVTEVRILYDDEFIYIAAYLFDDKKNIKTKQSSYDDWYEGFEKNADYILKDRERFFNVNK